MKGGPSRFSTVRWILYILGSASILLYISDALVGHTILQTMILEGENSFFRAPFRYLKIFALGMLLTIICALVAILPKTVIKLRIFCIFVVSVAIGSNLIARSQKRRDLVKDSITARLIENADVLESKILPMCLDEISKADGKMMEVPIDPGLNQIMGLSKYSRAGIGIDEQENEFIRIEFRMGVRSGLWITHGSPPWNAGSDVRQISEHFYVRFPGEKKESDPGN